jgi:Ser/Thr protein kinase RdoA (MazF antagonist)
MLPGEDILTTSRKPSPTFGRDAGRFIGELHAFPADRALALGVPLLEGPHLRTQRAQHYEDVIRRLFPLLSCEARTRVEQVYETYLNTVANFVFEPCLVHQDLDCNMLIDERGDLCGVIDFGDALVSSAALDFWLPLYGLKRLGIEAQVPACLAAAGIEGAALETMRPEVDFLDFRFPLLDMLQGLDTHDDALLEGGIQALNASLPRDIRC